tara:strand:- start:96 stop:617 length:522 start_codon:yes stop_codon:yes gene_type:complete
MNNIDDKLLLEAREERDILLSKMKSVILSTVCNSGYPNSSYAPCLYCFETNRFFIYISSLSKHTKNLLNNPCLSLMVIEDESESENLFVRKRYTLDASSLVVERNSSKWNNIMTSMEKKFGETIVFLKDLTDFSMFELVPSKSLLVYGFGKAFKFSEHNFEHAKHLNEKGHTK